MINPDVTMQTTMHSKVSVELIQSCKQAPAPKGVQRTKEGNPVFENGERQTKVHK
jgi:hypothetical protein